jgi:hypothetical protein
MSHSPPRAPRLAVLLLVAAPLGAATVQAPSGAAGWIAVTRGDEACVHGSSLHGSSVRGPVCWALPPTHQLTDLREISGGWVAAGYGAIDGVAELFLVAGDDRGVASLAVPPAGATPRGAPRLVADDNRLLGLVWLEGATQDRLQVRSAEWLDGAWGPTRTVSPAGSGSQVAPATTVLDDGRWLLLWTAFDGTDDETMWSLFDGADWSPPRRLHEDNGTPDITPTVIATRDGAVAAWSWLDGRDYRLRTAFFDGRGWHLAPPLDGRGALRARLVADSTSQALVFSTVVPSAWAAVELDARGAVLRRTVVSTERLDAPRVELGASGVTLAWDEPEAPEGGSGDRPSEPGQRRR